MKILFVCQQYIHSARWINQLKDSVHEIYVFDCLDKPIHENLVWANTITGWSKRKVRPLKGEYFLEKKVPSLYEKIEKRLKVTATEKLIEIIKEIQPDLVHSLEMQSETYPLINVRRKLDFNWAYFSWGSDLFLYQDAPQHRARLQKALGQIDYLFTDNKRDVLLAKKLNFQGKVMPVFPGGGGYHLDTYEALRIPFEKRNSLIIKGYHHWAGKAMYVLNALAIMIEEIKDLKIYVYSAHPIVIEKIEELKEKYGLKINYSSRYDQIPQRELLKQFGKASIAIGNNSSDGIPNTLLEALILGCFPIQSNPGKVTEEYIKHKENGLLIDNPEDSKEIAEKIRYALKNREMLEKAYAKNMELSKKLDYEKVKKEVIAVYKTIEEELR